MKKNEEKCKDILIFKLLLGVGFKINKEIQPKYKNFMQEYFFQ